MIHTNTKDEAGPDSTCAHVETLGCIVSRWMERNGFEELRQEELRQTEPLTMTEPATFNDTKKLLTV